MGSIAAVVLAAGSASRFGGGKLLAAYAGRPILQHVLNLAAELRLPQVVVVLGDGAADLIEACAWGTETRVVNDSPAHGISSSLRLGLAEISGGEIDHALILLGDQPLLSADQVGVVLGATGDPARPIVVPRYGGAPGNPVLLGRAAWHLATALQGDHGMSQLFATQPELVTYVDVPGVNPDVDTQADLAGL